MRMGARARRRLVVTTLASLPPLLGAVGVVRAAAPSVLAENEQNEQNGQNEKQARTLYERAEKSFDIGKFAEALADYQSAYEAKPLPGFLFNIAQCYRNMGNFERARFFFRRYLTLDPRAPNRRRVDELIAEMSKQLEAQAAAAASGSPNAPPSGEAKVGEAKVGEAKVGEAKVGEAKVGEAPLVVAPVTAPPPVGAPPLPAPASTAEPLTTMAAPAITATAPPASARPVWKRWWFWTGVGAVVAGGIVAGIILARPETRTPGSLDPIDARAP